MIDRIETALAAALIFGAGVGLGVGLERSRLPDVQSQHTLWGPPGIPDNITIGEVFSLEAYRAWSDRATCSAAPRRTTPSPKKTPTPRDRWTPQQWCYWSDANGVCLDEEVP